MAIIKTPEEIDRAKFDKSLSLLGRDNKSWCRNTKMVSSIDHYWGRIEVDLVTIDPSLPQAYIRPDGNEIPSPLDALERTTTFESTISQSSLKKFKSYFKYKYIVKKKA